MKKLLVSFITLFIVSGTFASVIITDPPLKASEIFLPVGNTGRTISVLDLAQIKVKDFETLTGKKMKFVERLTFKIAQRQLRNSINNDGSFNKKKGEEFFAKAGSGAGFNAGGFFLGLILGVIGVLIAYLINDDKKRNRVKWAWIGFGAWILIFIIWASTGSFTLF